MGPAGFRRRRAVLSTPLRLASPNKGHGSTVTRNNHLNQAIHRPYVIAGDQNTLAVALGNFYRSTSAEAGNGNSVTVESMAIEFPNGSVVPLFFNGSRSVTLATTDVVVMSSEISPSQAGYGSIFPSATLIYIKAILSVPVAGNTIPNSGRFTSWDPSGGDQADWFTPANTSVTSTDAVGKYVATGVAFSTNNQGYEPVLIGRPAVDRPSFIIVGDSIADRKEDSENNNFGHTFSMRSMHNADFGNPRPALNFALDSSRYSAVGGTRWAQYCQFARFAIDEYGVNDLGAGSSVASIQASANSVWAKMRANGCQKIIRTKYMPLTTSSDSFATAANQTKATKYQIGGDADLLNTYWETKAADGTIDYVMDMAPARDPLDSWLWKTTGATNYATTDGTHPSTVIHEALSEPLRELYLNLDAS